MRARSAGGRTPDFIVDRRGRIRTAAAVQASVLKAAVAKAGIVAACCAFVLTGTAYDVGEQAVAIAQVAKASVVDLIQRRSPGLRGRVSLADSKKAVRIRAVYRPKPRPKAPVPHSLQALVPPPPAAPIHFDEGEIAFAPMPIAGMGANLPPLSEECPCNWTYLPVDFWGGGLVIGGGGGGGVLPPGPPPPPPVIPEPQSWAMMILGFLTIGTMWRRRRVFVEMAGSALTLRLTYAPATLRA